MHRTFFRLLVLLASLNFAAGARAAAEAQHPAVPGPHDIIVYTAHQGFLSRIYLLDPDGTTITYFPYENYFFADLEVVNNELYAAEAFAPRVLKVDMHTGELEVIVDDLWLYYFYGVAFDGRYWYVDEWDLNRYEFDGTKDGVATFDESVAGSAWDGSELWTLNDEHNLIKSWDLSSWPVVTELPERRVVPPSANCRGLWFDGEYLWSTESIEGTPGSIYRFDFDGTVVDEWPAPAFRGWGVAVIEGDPFVLEVHRHGLAWSARYGAYAYDLVRGDLTSLRAASGDFGQAVIDCLADDHSDLVVTHTEDPEAGEGHWFLLRGVSQVLNLTYDTRQPGQVAPRDARIAAAPESCP
jgi:hypothetical protein